MSLYVLIYFDGAAFDYLMVVVGVTNDCQSVIQKYDS